MKQLPRRKPNRLKKYDYSQGGYYFVTVCPYDRKMLFGEIIDGVMLVNEYGKIAEEQILRIKQRYEIVDIDNYCIMPNHIHLLIVLNDKSERINPFPTADIPNIVGKFKAGVTRIVGNAFMRSETKPQIWQKSYHDRIIRNTAEYEKINEYITNNPLRWELDCHNPVSLKYKNWNDKN